MPRLLRVHFPGAIHHVTLRGVDRQPIFLSDKERRRFLQEVTDALKRHGAALLVYCLMSNHLHLLLLSGEQPIGRPLQEAFGRYSSFFNYVHGRTGHLFEGRYHAVLCKSGRQLLNTVVYILMNPVDAKLARHPSEWAWSSHGELVSGNSAWTDLSRLEDATGLGPAELREIYLQQLADELQKRKEQDELLMEVAASYGADLDELRAGRRGGAFTRAREDYAARAKAKGHSAADIARALKCSRSAVSQLLRRV
jgi:REP element-mobilizing transposase RayT